MASFSWFFGQTEIRVYVAVYLEVTRTYVAAVGGETRRFTIILSVFY